MTIKRKKITVCFSYPKGKGFALGDVPADAKHDDIIKTMAFEIENKSKGKYFNVKITDYKIIGEFDESAR